MGTGIYRRINGVLTELSVSQVKKVIMEQFGLSTKEEYNKFYDKFRNRLRTREKAGGIKEKASPVEVLYQEAIRKRTAEKMEREYVPTQRFAEIQKTPSLSSGQVSTLYAQRPTVISAEIDRLTDKFSHFIYSLPLTYQRQIGKVMAKNDVELYRTMLYALADKYHAQVKGSKAGIPQYSLSNNSYTGIGFDFNQYLT